MPFKNRTEAGRQLAGALSRYKGRDVVVLALPRGGVPVAAEVAEALGAQLDLVLVRKIGAPGNVELAMGAIAEAGGEPITVRNEDVIRILNVSDHEFQAVRDDQLKELERRRRAYLADRPSPDLTGRIAIVVDDGVATGATTRAALRAARRRGPEKVVLATPVAPTDVLPDLRSEADDVVCLEDYSDFGAIGFYYRNFNQLSDQDVVDLLARFPPPAPPAPPAAQKPAPSQTSG